VAVRGAARVGRTVDTARVLVLVAREAPQKELTKAMV